MEIKKNIPNNTITRKLVDLDKETGNIYETVNIIAVSYTHLTLPTILLV